MQHRWTAALVTSLLVVASLPGVVSAAPGGKALVAKDCRQTFSVQGFRNVGQCVRSSGQGSPGEPSQFQLTCEELGGTYAPTGYLPSTGTTVSPACSWPVTTDDSLRTYLDALRDQCQVGEILSGEQFDAGAGGAVLGCRPL